MVKRVLISLPDTFSESVDFVCSLESRNRSDLIREALRCYVSSQYKCQLHELQKHTLPEKPSPRRKKKVEDA